MKKPKYKITSDLDAVYELELYPKNGLQPAVVRVKCINKTEAENVGYIVFAAVEEPEQWQTATFCDEYFQWLIYRGIIVKM